MLSLPDGDRARAQPRRWLLGVALSSGVHVVVVMVLVISAHYRRGRGVGAGGADMTVPVPGPGSPAGAAAEAPESVTVDVVDPGEALPAIDVPPAAPAATEPEKPVAPPVRPRPARARVASSSPADAGAGAGPAAAEAPGPARPGGGVDAGPVVATPQGARDAGAAAAPGAPKPAAPPARPADHGVRVAYRAQLRRHLHDAWGAYQVYLRLDPQGRLAGSRFVTRVSVRIRADGTIEGAELATSSGEKAIDAEAMAALRRIQRLPPLPPSMIDGASGWSVVCTFVLDVGMFRFSAEIRKAIEARWRPSRAFARTAESEKQTTVKLLLTRDGKLMSGTVVGPAGLDFLDENALAWAQPGIQFPAPPPVFTRQAGPAQVLVAFLHRAGEVRVLRPQEDVEEE
jgi:TonB family protein